MIWIDARSIRSWLLLPVAIALLIPAASSSQVTEIIDSSGDEAGNPLNDPAGVAVDSGGNVYLAGDSSNNVFRITPGGIITEIIDATGDGLGNTLNIDNGGLAVDSSGNVYVAGGKSNNVFRIATPGPCSTSPSPCAITEIIDMTGHTLDECCDLATDPSGNVYVAGGISSKVFRIATPGLCSTSGTPCDITEIIDENGDGAGNALGNPLGVATDPSGNVYVTGFSSHNVFRIATPDDSCSTNGISSCIITEIVDVAGAGPGQLLISPDGVTTDPSGNAYATGYDNALQIVTPDSCGTTGGAPCTITEIIGENGDGTNDFERGRGITADSSGNVYVTGAWSNNAFQIAVPEPGTTASLVAGVLVLAAMKRRRG